MYCGKCGAPLNEGAKFCRNCGNKIMKEEAVQAAPLEEENTLEQEPLASQSAKAEEFKEEQQAKAEENNEAAETAKAEAAVYNFEAMPPVSSPPHKEYAIEPKQEGKNSPELNKPQKRKGLIAALVAVIVVLVLTIAAGATVVYFGFINPVDSDTFLGEILETIGIDLDDKDKKDRKNRYSADFEDEDESDNEAEIITEEAEAEHTYYAFISDVSWEEADYYATTYAEYSYLASINTKEEFEELTQMAYDEGIRVLWLGAKRDEDESWSDVYWNDGTMLDGLGLWFRGEPSYTADDGGESECYLMAFYVDGKWYLNDSVNDVSSVYAGKIGYIIEEEA